MMDLKHKLPKYPSTGSYSVVSDYACGCGAKMTNGKRANKKICFKLYKSFLCKYCKLMNQIYRSECASLQSLPRGLYKSDDDDINNSQ